MRFVAEKNSSSIADRLGVEPIRLSTSLRTVAIALTVSTALVAGVCIIAAIFRVGFGVQHGPINIISMLDFNAEATLPAWYSSALLLMSAMLLGIIAWIKLTQRELFRRHWLVLAALFLLLSIDEGIAIHERIAWPIERIFKLQGVFYYGWVIPGIVLVAAVGILYLKFLLHLPAKTRRRFVLSATIFIFGALVLEMVEGAYDSVYGNQSALYAAMVATEETLEMIGIALFVHTLVDYLRARYGAVSVAVHLTPGGSTRLCAPGVTAARVDSEPPDPAGRPPAAPADPVSV